jgi:hypothetical protein
MAQPNPANPASPTKGPIIPGPAKSGVVWIVLWCAFVAATIGYGIVLYNKFGLGGDSVGGGVLGEGEDFASRSRTRMMFTLIGIGFFLVGSFLPRLVSKSSGQGAYPTWSYLLGWIFLDGVAVFGFLVAYLQGQTNLYGVFLLLALVGYALTFPRKSLSRLG